MTFVFVMKPSLSAKANTLEKAGVPVRVTVKLTRLMYPAGDAEWCRTAEPLIV